MSGMGALFEQIGSHNSSSRRTQADQMLTPAREEGFALVRHMLVKQGSGRRSAGVMRRPFVVGLSDEAGAGANVGLAAKVCCYEQVLYIQTTGPVLETAFSDQ